MAGFRNSQFELVKIPIPTETLSANTQFIALIIKYFQNKSTIKFSHFNKKQNFDRIRQKKCKFF